MIVGRRAKGWEICLIHFICVVVFFLGDVTVASPRPKVLYGPPNALAGFATTSNRNSSSRSETSPSTVSHTEHNKCCFGKPQANLLEGQCPLHLTQIATIQAGPALRNSSLIGQCHQAHLVSSGNRAVPKDMQHPVASLC